MRTILFATVMLGLTASRVPAAAPVSEWTEFTSATTQPTPFALKQAKARGIELKQEPATPLRGLLVRPDGAGPFPAVVLLHGCDGAQPFQERWAADLAGWGYVVLLADSHGPRGIGDDCAHWPPTAGSRVFDAFGALKYLSSLTFVDAGRVGVIGWDTGARAVQRALEAKGVQQLVAERFAAGVEFYPTERPNGPVSAPVLVLIGDKDDCSPAARIQHAMAAFDPGLVPFVLEVLPDAGHSFDNPRFAEPIHFSYAQVQQCFETDTTMAYSKAARELAMDRVHAFLEEHLK
jgi:dienelactone hydrolase